MSTRSRIGVLNEDGTIRSIYVHWDGYPSNNGKILAEHYRDIRKIQKLIELGDISILGPEIGEKHDFDYKTCEYDGPSGVYKYPYTERTLTRWYKYPANVIKLWDTWCMAYGRDRGQHWREIGTEEHKNEAEFVQMGDNSDAEWLYLYKGGEWLCAEMPARGVKPRWNRMALAIKHEEKQYA